MQKSGKTGNNLNITRSEWFGSKRDMGGSVLNKIRKIGGLNLLMVTPG